MDGRRLILFSGTLLAICATAGYLFLRDRPDYSREEELIL
jgi:hypothetical protein